MKKITAKSGLIITAMLVTALLAFGLFNQQKQSQGNDASANEQQYSSNVQSKLNLKGMTRHLLDFYK